MEYEHHRKALQTGMIGLSDVCFSYGEKQILDHVTLLLPQAGAVCLFGPSGCGKTTILRLLSGLEKPQSGQVIGTEGKKIAVIFQENRLLPWRSVLDNVAFARGDSGDARDVARSCLARVGLSDVSESRPSALSGGMKRRVAIARALAMQGDILLLDEPFTGLDAPLRADMTQALTDAYQDRPILLITHFEEEAAAFAAPLIRLPQKPISGTFSV